MPWSWKFANVTLECVRLFSAVESGLGVASAVTASAHCAPMLDLNHLSVVGLLDPRLREKPRGRSAGAPANNANPPTPTPPFAAPTGPTGLLALDLPHSKNHHQKIATMEKRQQKSFAYHIPDSYPH